MPEANKNKPKPKAKLYFGNADELAKTNNYVTPEYLQEVDKRRKDWNEFIGFLKKENVAGSENLDKSGAGLGYLKKWNKANPDKAFTQEDIKDVQYYSRNTKKETGERVNDGILGKVTSTFSFPDSRVNTYEMKNGQKVLVKSEDPNIGNYQYQADKINFGIAGKNKADVSKLPIYNKNSATTDISWDKNDPIANNLLKEQTKKRSLSGQSLSKPEQFVKPLTATEYHPAVQEQLEGSYFDNNQKVVDYNQNLQQQKQAEVQQQADTRTALQKKLATSKSKDFTKEEALDYFNETGKILPQNKVQGKYNKNKQNQIIGINNKPLYETESYRTLKDLGYNIKEGIKSSYRNAEWDMGSRAVASGIFGAMPAMIAPIPTIAAVGAWMAQPAVTGLGDGIAKTLKKKTKRIKNEEFGMPTFQDDNSDLTQKREGGLISKYQEGGKTKKPVFPGKLDNRVVSDNTSVQRPSIQKQDVRLKTPQEVKKANRENFQKSIGVKPTYNVQELSDFGTPEPGLEDASLEALNALSLASGVGYLGKKGLQVGANYLGNKYLPNAYKLNPLAFKPNLEAYYRGIGRSGLDDALENKVIRPHKKGTYDKLYFTDDIKHTNIYAADPPKYKGDPFSQIGDDAWELIPGDYKKYIAEIPKKNIPFAKSVTKGTKNGLPAKGPYYTSEEFPSIDNVKFYKEDWLRGYKPIQYPNGGKVGEDFAYDKWRRSLPENLKYEDPNYNLRGYWESLNKPELFNPMEFQTEDDGLYHASSRNPETGEILKGKLHNTLQYALDEDRKSGYFTKMKDGKIYTDTYSDGGTINNMKKRTLKKYQYSYGGLTVTDLNKYDDGGVANKGTNAAAGALSTVANAVPGAGLAVPILDMMGKATSDEYGAPKSGLKGTANRINALSNLGRVMEGKDVGRSLLGLTPFGAIAEGTGLSKAIFGKSDYDIEAEERDFSKKNQELYTKMNSSQNFGNSNVNTSTNMMFAKGGMLLNQDDPNANAELELQETFQMPDGTVGNVDGPSHENGGIAVDLPEGTRIWSDKLKHNGKTFAKHTKPITNTIAKLEKQIEKNPVNSDAKENSIALLKNQLDYYFDTQENNKQNTEMKRTLREGGMIKRADGSYSKRGLWDNIRANKGSGKKPTPEMLKQERKINNEMAMGGYISKYEVGGTTPKPKPKPKPEVINKRLIFGQGQNADTLNIPNNIKVGITPNDSALMIAKLGLTPNDVENLKEIQEDQLWNAVNRNSNDSRFPKSEFGNWFKSQLNGDNRYRFQNRDYRIEQYSEGGTNNPGFNALPEEVQENILAHMSMGGRLMDDHMYAEGGKLPQGVLQSRLEAHMSPEEADEYLSEYGKGGYTVRRSSDRKGKTHVVIGPDGTKKYFGDPNMGERGNSKHGKDAFYARHKKNLAGNPYFRAYARATWEEGGTTPKFNYNNSEIDQITGRPTGKGGLEDASLDVLQTITTPLALANLYKAGKIGYDAYQLAKPGVINLSKNYSPTYRKALLQAGKALSPFEDGGMMDEEYAEGGIHIKPENRGKFTAYAKSHGKGVQEMAAHIMANKEDYSPAIVKRANFAKNAASWKHEMGGMVEYQRGGKRLNLETPTNNMEQRWIKPEDNTPQSVNSFEYPVEPDFDINNISEELYGNYGQALPKQSMATTRFMDQRLGTPPTMPPVERATGKYGEFVRPQVTTPGTGVLNPDYKEFNPFNKKEGARFSTPYAMAYETDPNIPKGQPIGSTAGAGMPTATTPESNWFKDNPGLVGQLGTAALTAGTQMNRINRLARPRTLADVRLRENVANPNLVDYSAERNAIDRAALTGMDQAQRGFGSSAAAQAFKNKARLNQLEGTGRSFQGQENANAQIRNQFLAARQEAAMKEAMMNSEIGKYNLENVYGYDENKTRDLNAITGQLGNVASQTFGNISANKNQLKQLEMLARGNYKGVNRKTLIDLGIDDQTYETLTGQPAPKKYGGTIKRSFKIKKFNN